MSEEKYVVIAEHKAEEALVFETFLSSASYDQADARFKHLLKDPNIVRVAIARLVYVAGHKGLLPPDPAPVPVPF